mmetsp:Transcript_28569/g.66196  ORF Transcript_28569/g.66196 Transcript_28569/m.66196 type:complete len:174 (-) Transcript_28569:84-605(-)|eukprot:CAMPEP_0178396186 /NCGR_PEP_ID=MMETSP0689_2-20121128/13601_1 /TAXON_ID=160604 /ORGANISM="Amphidinium massartii, Strain CS-259" /LENGTH=173 /DNA_ID=CAMNT_0020016857 /DNA_START=9 /DNA_END=530 /DNA_ORIENTATION=+
MAPSMARRTDASTLTRQTTASASGVLPPPSDNSCSSLTSYGSLLALQQERGSCEACSEDWGDIEAYEGTYNRQSIASLTLVEWNMSFEETAWPSERGLDRGQQAGPSPTSTGLATSTSRIQFSSKAQTVLVHPQSSAGGEKGDAVSHPSGSEQAHQLPSSGLVHCSRKALISL